MPAGNPRLHGETWLQERRRPRSRSWPEKAGFGSVGLTSRPRRTPGSRRPRLRLHSCGARRRSTTADAGSGQSTRGQLGLDHGLNTPSPRSIKPRLAGSCRPVGELELRGATDRGLGLLIRRSDEAHLHERRRRRRRPGAVQSRAVAGPSTRGMHAKLLVQSWIGERVVVKRDAPVGKEFSDRGARDIGGELGQPGVWRALLLLAGACA